MRDEELIEAALFVAGEPVSEKKLKKIVGSLRKTQRAIEHLIYEYRERETALEIVELDRKYVMQLKPEYSKHVEKIAPREISAPALRTLAIIAYHQPITQRELVQIRGNTIYDHIQELNERGLIKARPHGRTKILTTGRNFPEYFNLTTNDPKKIREKMIELAKEEGINLNHKNPEILTTPMYESLLKHCGIQNYRVTDRVYTDPERTEELKTANIVILNRGYGKRLKNHYKGKIIEVNGATFQDLIESMEKLKEIGNKKTINEKISTIKEIKKKWVEKTLTITTPVTPQTEMARKIAKELRLPISTKGKKMAPNNNDHNAEIIIPTHQKGLDIIERIETRYKSIINQIKRIEEGTEEKKSSEKAN
ncbi:MAG: SMC-Scp complex subunit ScpB [Methanosarcinales archaeon]